MRPDKATKVGQCLPQCVSALQCVVIKQRSSALVRQCVYMTHYTTHCGTQPGAGQCVEEKPTHTLGTRGGGVECGAGRKLILPEGPHKTYDRAHP